MLPGRRVYGEGMTRSVAQEPGTGARRGGPPQRPALAPAAPGRPGLSSGPAGHALAAPTVFLALPGVNDHWPRSLGGIQVAVREETQDEDYSLKRVPWVLPLLS